MAQSCNTDTKLWHTVGIPTISIPAQGCQSALVRHRSKRRSPLRSPKLCPFTFPFGQSHLSRCWDSQQWIVGTVIPLPKPLLTKALFQRFAHANPPLTRLMSFLILWWKFLPFPFPHQPWGGIFFILYEHESSYSEKCFLHSVSRNKIFWDRISWCNSG